MLDKIKDILRNFFCKLDLSLERAPGAAPLIASLCGVVLAFLILPSDLLLGRPSYWDHVDGDNSANLTGYLALAHDDWRWPLFKTVILFPPDGVNILFADPIPVMALLGKIAFKTTGWLPNYFGPWLLAAYALQPVAAYFLLRAFEFRKLAALVGGLLFLLMPAFIFRFGHFPLVCHWLLIVALLIHVKISRGELRPYLIGGAVFTVLVVFINPYLLVMVAAIYAAALCDAVLNGKMRLPSAALALISTAAAVIACALLSGFISLDKASPAIDGFGRFSMNLLSPVWPQLSLFAKSPNFILDETSGQYEGFNYFGAGLLLLLIAAVIAARPALATLFGRSRALLASAVLLAVYALSSRIYAGHYFVGEIPYDAFGPVAKITGIFRSSGRFFWPLAYLLVFVSATAIYARLGAARFVALSLVLLSFQIADIRPLLSWVSARAAVTADVIDRDKWKAALLQHDELLILPRRACAGTPPEKQLNQLATLAAGLPVPSSSAYMNRSDIDCPAEWQAFGKDLKALATRPNPLIVVLKSEVSPVWLASASRGAGVACADAGFAFVCSATLGEGLARLGGEIKPPPTAKAGETLGAAEGQKGVQFLGYGWSVPQQDAVWGVGSEGVLMARMTEEICGDAVFRARITPFAWGSHRVDRAVVTINGGAPIDFVLTDMSQQDIEAPVHQTGCSDRFDVKLNFFNLKSPKELHMNTDTRLVNWMLHSFSVDKRP